MTRSLKKGYYVNMKLLAKVQAMATSGDKKVLKIYDRACTIIPDFVGFTFAVHNGKQFVTLFISEEMIGHKFGEFVPTRTFRGHPF